MNKYLLLILNFSICVEYAASTDFNAVYQQGIDLGKNAAAQIAPPPAYQKNTDFYSSISALSGTAAAAKSFDARFIFKGSIEQCRDDAGDFSNCCNAHGWGQDWHLAHCNTTEKLLGSNRQHGTTIYVGRYCAQFMPWPLSHVCVAHKETYCSFDSKLGRIMQSQGRAGQLHIGFGTPQHPNCAGLTPQQLQIIDLSKINFTDFYTDINNKMPQHDLSAVQNVILDHVKNLRGW